MRRWSLPGGRALGAAAAAVRGDGDGDGDIEAPPRRRASVPAAPPPAPPPTAEELQAAETARLQALAEEELRLSIIYAQLSEVFGVDFGQPFGGVLVDAEVETVATTRTNPSCPSENGEGGEGEGEGAEGGGATGSDPAGGGTAPRRSRRSENTHQIYALDPDTGLPLPEATPVGRERTMREDDRYYDCWQVCMCFILIMFGVVIGSAAIIFLLFIILS